MTAAAFRSRNKNVTSARKKLETKVDLEIYTSLCYVLARMRSPAVRLSLRPYVALRRGRVKRCTSFVCLSVRFSRNRKAVETSNLVDTWHWTRVSREANLRSKGLKWNENVCKIVIRAYIRQKWIDLVKPRPQ